MKNFLFKHCDKQHTDAIITDKLIKDGDSYYLWLRFADHYHCRLKVSQDVYQSSRQGQRLIVGYQQTTDQLQRHITSIH